MAVHSVKKCIFYYYYVYFINICLINVFFFLSTRLKGKFNRSKMFFVLYFINILMKKLCLYINNQINRKNFYIIHCRHGSKKVTKKNIMVTKS